MQHVLADLVTWLAWVPYSICSTDKQSVSVDAPGSMGSKEEVAAGVVGVEEDEKDMAQPGGHRRRHVCTQGTTAARRESPADGQLIRARFWAC